MATIIQRCISTSKVNSEGGYTISEEEKSQLLSEINKLNDYVIKFKSKNISKSGDSIAINTKKLKVLNENNMYTVFQSKGKYFILKTSIISLIIGITFGIILYLTFTWFKNEMKIYLKENNNFLTCIGHFCLFIVSIMVGVMYLRNYRYKVWKFIKKIELSKDMKKLTFTSLLNKKFEEDLINVYLYYNYTPFYHSIRTLTKVNDTIILGIKKKIFVISLEDADVPDWDLFACCVRGYNIKAL